jgi:hypothetical protein
MMFQTERKTENEIGGVIPMSMTTLKKPGLPGFFLSKQAQINGEPAMRPD